MIDIVNLKTASYLIFYVENKCIYCENTLTNEKVIVGELKEGKE